MSQLAAVTISGTLLFTLYLVALVVSYVLYGLWMFRIFKVQTRLRKAEVIVRLKANKLLYRLLFVLLTAVLSVFIVLTVSDGMIQECIIFSLIIGGLIVLIFFMLFAKSGITAEGIYTMNRFIPWDKCYDYYVDKDKRTISFSNNVKGGLTLVGTTFPERYEPEDEEKLYAVLDAQKGRFSKDMVVR